MKAKPASCKQAHLAGRKNAGHPAEPGLGSLEVAFVTHDAPLETVVQEAVAVVDIDQQQGLGQLVPQRLALCMPHGDK